MSSIQYQDLERLRIDRNRCAHPSMNSEDEVYQPSAELARYHLRNAIEHLLQHPPVQGKTALEYLQKEVQSEYFPLTLDGATEFLRGGPLSTPKQSLLKDWIKSTITTILRDQYPDKQLNRFYISIEVTRILHPLHTNDYIRDCLHTIVMNLEDEKLYRLIRLLGGVSDIWHLIRPNDHPKIQTYVENMSDEDVEKILEIAIAIAELRTSGIKRAIQFYRETGDPDQVTSIAQQLLKPVIEFFSEEAIDSLCDAAFNNVFIKENPSFIELLQLLHNNNIITNKKLRILLKRFNLSDIESKVFSYVQPEDDIPF